MPSVESFELDHNAVVAPYVRHCGVTLPFSILLKHLSGLLSHERIHI